MIKIFIPVLLCFSGISMEAGMSFSPVEEVFLKKSGRQSSYSGEKLPVIETDNVCLLGKLTALSFIEWVLENPEGVISLPTGKTPELFIAYLKHYKEHWSNPETKQDLQLYGIHADYFPDTSKLKFVQLDEFYPIDPNQKNSFTSYVKRYYLNFLRIPKENVLGMDLTQDGVLGEHGIQHVFPEGKVDHALIEREPLDDEESLQKLALEEMNQFCEQFEEKVREWGGIGFFLGGIGPDGHIAFNMQGSSHDSKTRLVQLNYPSAAAAAGDLGGIEFSRDKLAITIGLETIRWNPDAKIIILAAGEVKAPIVANAIEQDQSVEYPATSLHGHQGARFYLTKGASCNLKARQLEDVENADWEELTPQLIDNIVIELALQENKRIEALRVRDYTRTPKGFALLKKYKEKITDLNKQVHKRLVAKIEKDLHLKGNRTILHTAPHHDDVMLSYHPMLRDLLPNNENHFAYLTSGFNSVTNGYMMSLLTSNPESEIPSEILSQDYEGLLREFLSAAEQEDTEKMTRIEWYVLLQNTAKAFGISDVESLRNNVRWLINEYFPNHHPGEKDITEVQILKCSMRESESDRMLLLAGVSLDSIYHMRAHFYNGDYFNPMPTIEKDALPMLEFYRQIQPDVITVAFDPEGTGPDTHYKVLQVVAEGLRLSPEELKPKVWGYRNVWHHFKLGNANLMMPVTDQDLADLNFSFLNCFSTQKTASFPPTNYDGPFSGLSEQIQRDQYEQIKILLGEKYFSEHSDPRIRNATGFVFIQEMTTEEFFQHAQELKSRIELHQK